MERLLRGDILYKVGLLQLALRIGNWGSGYDLTCGGYNSFITGRGSPCKDRSGLLGIEFALDPTRICNCMVNRRFGLVIIAKNYHKDQPNVGKYTSSMDGMG